MGEILTEQRVKSQRNRVLSPQPRRYLLRREACEAIINAYQKIVF